MASQKDCDILRELGKQYMAAAADSRNGETIRLWKALNSGTMERPMVNIDQLPYHELEADASLQCQTEEPYWRKIEQTMRRQLYMWEHFPADMVLEPFVKLPMSITDLGYGLDFEQDAFATYSSNDVVAHRVKPVIDENFDLSRIQNRTFKHDSTETRRRFIEGEDIFSGIMPVRVYGITFNLAIWDTLTAWLGVEKCYTLIKDNPDFIHKLLRKVTNAFTAGIRQVNTMKISHDVANTCHSSYVYDDKLLLTPGKSRGGVTNHSWAYGMAQLFTSISPEITKEFEIPYVRELAWEFGAMYYGCSEVLSDRLDVLKRIPNVRKIACAPSSDKERFAETLDKNIIMSAKPNPTFLAASILDEDIIRKDLMETCAVAKKHGKKLEIILNDISTVRQQPERLQKWNQIAMEVVQSW